MNANATASSPAPATFADAEYDHRREVGHVDGVEVEVGTDYDPPAPEIGIYSGQWGASVAPETARLVDRAEWDAAHPGVEPTTDAIQAVARAAATTIEDMACDAAADAAADQEPDFDDGDDGGDWEGY